jgi:hypothetical protein
VIEAADNIPPRLTARSNRATNQNQNQNQQQSAITVTWRAPAGDACVDSYDYVVLEAGKPEPRTLSWFNKKGYSLTVTNLKPGTDHVVKVAAVNGQRGRGQYATINVATRRERCGLFANRRPGAGQGVGVWKGWYLLLASACLPSNFFVPGTPFSHPASPKPKPNTRNQNQNQRPRVGRVVHADGADDRLHLVAAAQRGLHVVVPRRRV